MDRPIPSDEAGNSSIPQMSSMPKNGNKIFGDASGEGTVDDNDMGNFVDTDDANLLLDATNTWKRLIDYSYTFIIAYRNKVSTINLCFAPNDFHHLAGFQYLRDLSLPRYSPAKIIDPILDGKITQATIEKGLQYEKMVKPRLQALRTLEQMLDQEFTLYSFIARFLPFYSQIEAQYLIANEINDVSFVFLVRSSNQNDGPDAKDAKDRHNIQGESHQNAVENTVFECTCVSTFQKGEKDFTRNQRPYTLLKKTKKNLLTNTEIVLYVRPGYE